MSSEESPIRAKETAVGLQTHLDTYFDETFWAECAELVSGCYTKGFEYLYAYKDTNDKLAFQCADSIGVVEVRENDTDEVPTCFIYWYVDRVEKGKKLIKRIQVHTADDITYYVQDGSTGKIQLDKSKELNPKPNVVYEMNGKKYGEGLGFIPFFRLDYNKKQFSGLKPIKGLIDDYDLMECGLSNNLQDFDHPIYAVKGFEGDNLTELGQNLRTKKMVGVGEQGGIDIMTIDVPYQARKTKADEDEKTIYRFGMGLNTQGLKDTSATTNLAIQAAYTLLDLKADKLITRLKRFLKDIVKIVLDEINAVNNIGYQLSDVYFEFVPNVLVNEQENIQNEKTRAETEQLKINNILTVAAHIGDEETLKAICDILDMDYEEIKEQIKDNEVPITDAQNTLNNVIVDDEGGEE